MDDEPEFWLEKFQESMLSRRQRLRGVFHRLLHNPGLCKKIKLITVGWDDQGIYLDQFLLTNNHDPYNTGDSQSYINFERRLPDSHSSPRTWQLDCRDSSGDHLQDIFHVRMAQGSLLMFVAHGFDYLRHTQIIQEFDPVKIKALFPCEVENYFSEEFIEPALEEVLK